MCGPIHGNRHDNQIGREVQKARDKVLLSEKRTTRPVHVILWTPEKVDWDHNPCRKCLKFPTTRVISQPAARPQEQRQRGKRTGFIVAIRDLSFLFGTGNTLQCATGPRNLRTTFLKLPP